MVLIWRYRQNECYYYYYYVTQKGVGGFKFPGKKCYECVGLLFNIISMGVKIPEKNQKKSEKIKKKALQRNT